MEKGDRSLWICLDPEEYARAIAGENNFLNLVVQTLEGRDFGCEFRRNSVETLASARRRMVWTLRLLQPPLDERGFTYRKVYFFPFWRIDRSEKRWESTVARASFAAAEIDHAAARRFAANARERLFKGRAEASRRDGFIYAPLQGKLLDHRSFQAASPLAMLAAVIRRLPGRRIVATLHPKEFYSREERAALDEMVAAHPDLTIGTAPSEELLQGCDMVVTENSSVAFAGYFFRKPAVLFAQADFHHIAASVPHLGEAEAFRRVQGDLPDFDGYLWWFLQQMAVNAWQDSAPDRIAKAFAEGGMPF